MEKDIRNIIAIIGTLPISLVANAWSIEPADTLAPDSTFFIAASATAGEQFNMYARPEPLYKTPEAQAFQQFGAFGTEGSTGSVDISIPIHTISCRDLQIPISLHYAGSGIKVAQEASWVGLGWDLSVGGCINIVAAGQYDYLARNSSWSDYLKLLGSKTTETFQLPLDHDDYAVTQDILNGMGERDFYSVNILGRSFLFFIDPYTDQPAVIGAEDGVYSISRSGVDGWLIKDVMGYNYDFSTVEYSMLDGAGMQKSAIYLSSIETTEGITAIFNYERTYVKGIPQAYQWYDAQRACVQHIGSTTSTYSFPNYGSGSSFSNTEIDKPWLKSIKTDNQTVTFELSDRTDYAGGKKVDRITVSDINGSSIFTHEFKYGTFNHSTVGGSCPDTNNHLLTSVTNSERLKLLSYGVRSTDRMDALTYTFSYNEQYPLPLKTSAAIDFWGYYNGKENTSVNKDITDSRSLIPSLQDCLIGYTPTAKPHVSALAVKGACRFSNAEKMQSGTLTSITYPTGGKTVFTFEPHTFRSKPVYPLQNTGYTDIEATVEDNNYPTDAYNPGPVTSRKIDTRGHASGYLTVTFCAMAGKKLRDLQMAKAGITLQPMGAPTYRKILVTLDSCAYANLDESLYSTSFAVTLDSVPYMLIADLPQQLNYGEGYVKATLSLRDINPSLESGGAGLRIAAMDNYDKDGTLIEHKEYEYLNANGKTSGVSIVNSRPTTFRYKFLEHSFNQDDHGILQNAILDEYSVINISSSLSSGPAITSAIANNTVGYERVTEKTMDGTGKLISSTVRNYNVYTATEVLPDIHLPYTLGGGELIGEAILNAAGDTLKTVEYQYQSKGRRISKCNMTIEDRYYEYLDRLVPSQHPVPRYIVSVYPYHSYWRVLSSIRTREHTAAGVAETLLSMSYNTKNHLKSEETISNGSSGSRTSYTYPVDYTSDYYALMCSPDNFVCGVPVETTTANLVNGTYTESRRLKYSYNFQPNNVAMLQLRNVQESVAGGPLTTREAYTYSSSDGTLVGVVEDDAAQRAFLWSYAHTCPVALIEGASYQDVRNWAGPDLISSLSAAKGNADGLLSQLRTALQGKNVSLTTFSFKPLVGITSATAPNGNKTSYEYDRFNRLSRILDHNGKVVQTFTYDYGATQGACITTRTMLDASASRSANVASYHDGLGRQVQTVQTGVNTTGRPVVAYSELDPAGNPVRQWLPVAVASGTTVTASNVASLSSAFHSDSYAYSSITYDALGRQTYASDSGEAWSRASKGVATAYSANAANSVKMYRADVNGTGVTQSGYWPARSLQSVKTTDEDGLTMEVFTDAAGHTVLERRGGNNDTYYVYNNAGQLRYVLQPMYTQTPDASLYAFEYSYDTKGNRVSRKVPGCEPETFTYDIGRRLTFMQDARLKAQGLHRFYLYDNLGRLAIQGTTASCNLAEALNTATYTGGTSGFMSTGYTLSDASRIKQASIEVVNYYDDYTFASTLSSGLTQTTSVSAKGLATGSVVYNSEGGKSMSAIYYDIHGNVTTLREYTDFGKLRITTNTYNFTNQLLTSKMVESDGVTMLTENTYDAGSGLLVATDVTINGAKQRVSKVTYDDLGRITSVVRGNGSGSGGTVSYTYNIHGQTTSISGPGLKQQLNYTDGPGTPRYNGSVSSMLWSAGNETKRGYKYTYNSYNWLTTAEYAEGESLSSNKNRYTEQSASFTRNGGITRLVRYGVKADGTFGKVDDLHITYDGNRIATVRDDADAVTQAGSMDYPGGASAMAFEYDSSGSLIKDESRGIKSVEYDNFGNPVYIQIDGGYTKNVYSASGVKLKTTHYTKPYSSVLPGIQVAAVEPLGIIDPGDMQLQGQETLEYHGPVIYRNGKIDMVLFPGGYATISGTTVTFHYYTQDYLGNNRAVVNGTTGLIEQTTAYYPYGAVIPDIGTGNTSQPFKFGGKELISANGLNMYDFGARLHYPAVPHFTSIDPMSEKYYWLSPYLYCANNPVNFVDLDGRDVNLWATTLPDTKDWIKDSGATHTFITVTDKNNVTHYFAYGSNRDGFTGAFSGKLVKKEFNQDEQVYKGKNSKDLKAKITINPPEGMSQDDFDKAVIEVAESFGNQDAIGYYLTATPELSGNCNSSSSTILNKAGISTEELQKIESEIPGHRWGFGNIKPWTEDEQKAAIKSAINRLLYYGTLEQSLH